MNPQTQRYLLGTLLGVLALVTGWNWRSGGSPLATVFTGDTRIERFPVANPTLRLDKLKEIRKLDYEGKYKDIFQYVAEKMALPSDTQKPAETTATVPVKAPEPPWVPPFKFYGFVVDGRTGRKRGFFTNGEDIWVAGEGDTIQARCKLLRLGNKDAEVEEVATGRRATLPLEESAAPSGM
jgi:hypothetical protein